MNRLIGDFCFPGPHSTLLEVNLASATHTSLLQGFAFTESLTLPNSTCLCNSEGVMEMTFDPGSRGQAEVTMVFGGHDFVTFYMGDVDSNGFGK